VHLLAALSLGFCSLKEDTGDVVLPASVSSELFFHNQCVISCFTSTSSSPKMWLLCLSVWQYVVAKTQTRNHTEVRKFKFLCVFVNEELVMRILTVCRKCYHNTCTLLLQPWLPYVITRVWIEFHNVFGHLLGHMKLIERSQFYVYRISCMVCEMSLKK
jgi:hypothetical protein